MLSYRIQTSRQSNLTKAASKPLRLTMGDGTPVQCALGLQMQKDVNLLSRLVKVSV